VHNLISVYITVTVLIENTCFLQTWYTIPKEQRIQLYTDPRKQHIAYTIFYGCVYANGVGTVYSVCIYSSKANRPSLVHKTLYTNGMRHRRHRHTYWRCPPKTRCSPAGQDRSETSTPHHRKKGNTPYIHLNIPGQQSAHNTSTMCTRLIRLDYRCQMNEISSWPYIKNIVYLLTLVIVIWWWPQ